MLPVFQLQCNICSLLGYFNFAAVHGGKLVEFFTHIEADQKAPEAGDRERDMAEGTAERSPIRLEMVTLNPDPGIGESKAQFFSM